MKDSNPSLKNIKDLIKSDIKTNNSNNLFSPKQSTIILNKNETRDSLEINLQHSTSNVHSSMKKDSFKDTIKEYNLTKTESNFNKVFKKTSSKKDDKFIILSEKLIDRANLKDTIKRDKSSNLDNNNSNNNMNMNSTNGFNNKGLSRQKSEVNFGLKTTRLPDIGSIKNIRENKFKKDGINSLMKPIFSHREN